MITGWIWLDENKTYNMAKCLKKALIPLFSFGYLYALMELVFDERKITLPVLFKALGNVLAGKLWVHMWYLYMLAGLYLVMPALKILVRYMSEKQLRYGLVLLFVFQILFPTLEIVTGFKVGFYLPVETPYLLYLFLGHYLSKHVLPLRFAVINSVASLFVLFAFCSVEKKGMYNQDLTVFWISCALFMLALAIQPYCAKADGKVLYYIGKKTFGIYILHMLFVNLLFKVVKFDPFMLPNGVNWLVLTVFIFCLSLLATIVIQKIPVINKIFCI